MKIKTQKEIKKYVKKRQENAMGPLFIFIFIASLVFFAELFIMEGIQFIFFPDETQFNLPGVLDPVFLTLIVTPVLYFLVLQPMKKSEERLSAIFNTLSEGVALNEIVLNEKGEMIDYRIIEVNPAFYSTADFISEGDVVGLTATEIYKMTSETIHKFWEGHKNKKSPVISEMVSPVSKRNYLITTSPFFDSKFVTTFYDITEIKRNQKKLAESENILRQSQEVAGIGSYSWDIAKDEWVGTEVLYELFGIDSTYNRNFKGWIDLLYPDDRQELMDYVNVHVLKNKKPFKREYRVVNKKTGKVLWVNGFGRLKFNDYNEPEMMFGVIQDISEKKESTEKIEILSYYDHLTGLPNRKLLKDRFDYVLSLAKRNEDSVALMYIDLDHFKNINETLGHTIGDLYLIEISKKLKNILREGDILSRQGGDEFILIFPGASVENAGVIASKIMKTISEPVIIEGNELISFLSIGIAVFPEDGNSSEELSKNADAALFRAKESGRNNFCFYTVDLQNQLDKSLKTFYGLKKGIEKGELFLHYQPQFDIHYERIIGAEALVRWNSPESGIIQPSEFIPIAEESGLIIELGNWVFNSAAAQLRSWIDKGLPSIIMAINLSPIQFRQKNFPLEAEKVLSKYNIPKNMLEFELTEAATMQNPREAIRLMNELMELGVRISIDDFGTGYSNLAYLKQFKAYKLKIDKSFVTNLGYSEEDRAIAKAIINMARSLGLQTIAEGVETHEQLDFLRQQGCDEIQGFLLGRPLSSEDFYLLARKNLSGK